VPPRCRLFHLEALSSVSSVEPRSLLIMSTALYVAESSLTRRGLKYSMDALDTDRRVDILLAEYQACHMNRDHYHGIVWTMGSIFITASIALFGASLVEPIVKNPSAVAVLAICSIILLVTWLAYNFHVDPWVTKSLRRCREIEEEFSRMKYTSSVCIKPPIPRLHTLIGARPQIPGIWITISFFTAMLMVWLIRVALLLIM